MRATCGVSSKSLRATSWAIVSIALLAAGCATSPASTGERSGGRVVRVVDGDTLIVRIDGASERVRLLGIDTPEESRSGADAECGAGAASASLEALATAGARARLVTDGGTGDVRDQYGRLLAFVSIDGHDLALAQLERGWARVYAYRDRRFTRRGLYERAYRSATRRHLGVHRECRAR